MNPIEQLKSVLCDPSGKCCISGSDEDRAIVDRALLALTPPNPPNPPKRPWRPMTEEEKDGLLLPFGSYGEIEAIEAKLKEIHGV